jgi:hypothetical protein
LGIALGTLGLALGTLGLALGTFGLALTTLGLALGLAAILTHLYTPLTFETDLQRFPSFPIYTWSLHPISFAALGGEGLSKYFFNLYSGHVIYYFKKKKKYSGNQIRMGD